MRSEFNERTLLAWLSKVRIIVITFLLAIELAIVRLTVTAVPERAFISVIALWYTISLFFVLLLPLWREQGVQARLQVMTDLVFANAVIYLSGGGDTSFYLLNPAGEKLMETSASAVFGKPVTQFLLDRLPPMGPHPVRNEVRCLNPKGTEKTFGVTASELRVPERGLIGYVYAFADLTEIRRLERELRMRDRLAAIGRMAGGIAHEIRNPLASIAGSVQVLVGISELTPDQKALVDIVLRESDSLNGIITDFLLYAREKTYKM